ncbi:RNA polymerase sigma factor SigJ [Streptomyces sp. NPDC006475]|uniref:RNA polymerase sigma factor SigJ n=1 Tax=Streptomyces sp. NPDC006475 TaxID=3155719 RepID=UPI0033ABBF61
MAAAEYRSLLFSIAYGMTGSVSDAEDIVQDAFLGFTRALQAGTVIVNAKAYLTTSVTRLGINVIRSARSGRESYVGEWLPEPVVELSDRLHPVEHAELTESLSMAFLVLLETLSPVERAVLVLREVFGYGYPDVARATGKSEANCRQILTRARKRIAAGRQETPGLPAPARRAEGERLARTFFDAAAGGDLNALLKMLAPEVVFYGDGGGRARAIKKPLTGSQRIVRLLIGGFNKLHTLGASYQPARINGRPGAVVYDAAQRVVSVIELHMVDEVVEAIHSVSNPDKLGHIGPVSDIGLLTQQ